LEVGDVKQGERYCGVVILHNMTWTEDKITNAYFDIYLAPLSKTNILAENNGHSDHRVMMEELSLWKKFEKFKLRASDNEGNRNEKFMAEGVKEETELFYGFTRTNDFWKPTSCTLNSWVKPRNGKNAAAAMALRQAGTRYADKWKADKINIIPTDLWKRIFSRLLSLTPSDLWKWSSDWARIWKYSLGPAEFAKEELVRMRRSVTHGQEGSKLYQLFLNGIGWAGISSVRALATVLQEFEGHDKVPRCSYLRELSLYICKHTGELAPVISNCCNLETLELEWNETDEKGAIALLEVLPSKLRSLKLPDNKIGDKGAIALSENMPKKLEILYLRDNNIGDKGAIALAKSIPKKLEFLSLNNNEIGTEGFNALLNVLKNKDNCLLGVSLRNNPCYDPMKTILAQAEREKKTYLK